MSIRRDYVAEIEAKRGRSRWYEVAGASRVSTLSDVFKRARHDAELRRYFPIALIAVVEASTRFALTRLIDNTSGGLNSFLASQWAKEQKFDLTILRAIAGRRLTIGELISHLVP